MTNILEKINKNKNKKLFLDKIKIKTKNLDINPNRGGIPANDSNIKTINIVIKGKLPKNFNSFSVFKYFISNIKNSKNIFISIKIYDNRLNIIIEKEYSLKYPEKEKLLIKNIFIYE